MITAVHNLVYSSDPEATRAFFRDVLRFSSVDAGGGWLIFKTGPSELGVHPNTWQDDGVPGGTDQRFEISLICDDLAATMAELTARGAVLGETDEADWGATVRVEVPGAGSMLIFEPKFPPPALGD